MDVQSDLENRLATVESQLNEITHSCAHCPGGPHPMTSSGPRPAFMAALSSDPFSCFPDSPLIFDNVKLNVGSPYDARHGTFRAPRNGTYFFAATLTASPDSYFHMKFVINSLTNEVGYLYADGQHPDFLERSTSIVVRLNAGDDVWIACIYDSHVSGGHSGTARDYHSHFEGFLVD
ncbi:complement C1q tumor necrosis factor-related protein 4-like [Mya arenaria]|uniref:complement C1q tumor necrosis factor-related protein 4-like n=1 Tax=Mya arenaria TaxID=6604 RepID=UPI0022E7A198|nr:complement C1q tumor necrosis factor-related protein 4-like [Mya arenaria]